MLENSEKCLMNHETWISILFITALLTLIKGWMGQEQAMMLVTPLWVNTNLETCHTEIMGTHYKETN